MELYKKIAQYGYLQKTSTNYKFLLNIKIIKLIDLLCFTK